MMDISRMTTKPSIGGMCYAVDDFMESLKNKTLRDEDADAVWVQAQRIAKEEPHLVSAMAGWMEEHGINTIEQQKAYIWFLRSHMSESLYGDDGPPPGEIVSRRAWNIDMG